MKAPVGSLLATLPLLLGVFALMQVRVAPPVPKPADAAATEFSAGRARVILRDLVGDGRPHPTGTEANARVRERILVELSRLGYAPEVQNAFACDRYGTCGAVKNVLALLPGAQAGKAVLLAAHYDSVAAGPGASDDGAGVAALLEIARALKGDPPRRNPVIFLLDDGEEAGLLGAKAFAEGHPWAREVGAVINVEARGSRGPSLMFETSPDNAWLVRLLAASVERPVTSSLFYSVSQRLPNDTDLTVFKEHGLAGLNFAYVGGVMHYHTPLDSFENADPRSLQHHGDNALAMARALAEADLSRPPPGDAVFFDVLSLATVWWPETWTVPLALAAALLLAISISVRMRQGRLSGRALAWGLLASLLTPVIAAGLAFGMSRGLRAVGALPRGWIAQPLPALATFSLLGWAVAGVAAALLSRRAGPGGLWSGTWILWALLALVSAFDAPEESYPLLVPALVAGAAGLLSLRRSGSGVALPAGSLRAPWAGSHRAPWAPALTVTLPALVATSLWFPLAWLLYEGVGTLILPAVAGVMAFQATTLLPLIASPQGRRRWAFPAVTGAAALASALLTLAAPPYTEDAPERVGIVLYQDDSGGARWLAFPRSGTLPAPLRASAAFGAEPLVPFPWNPQERAFAAPGPRVEGPPPELNVLERSESGSDRRMRGRLRSPRGAPVIAIYFPPSARVGAMTIGGRSIASLRERALRRSGGWQAYTCLTLPPEGVEIDLILSGAEPVEAFVVDQSPGLPDDALPRARPATATASGPGDVTVLSRRVTL